MTSGLEPLWYDRLLWRLRGKPHRVTVHDVRPTSDDDFEPYVVAICECGWIGDFHETTEPAFSDAYGHSPEMTPDPIRPLGRSG